MNPSPDSAPLIAPALAEKAGGGMRAGTGLGGSSAHRGRFISFEGIDGAGKSTHLDALAEALRAQGHEVLVTREPGGTPLAEQLRALFLQHEMDALTEALLVFAGRRDHVNTVIAPALARGAMVVCDRFTDATFAYQGGGRGFDSAVLAQLEAWVQQDADMPGGLLQPDLTLWFDLPPAVAAARRGAARAADRLEREDIAFFERVRAGYAARAAQATARFARIDADQPKAAVWGQVQQAVAQSIATAATSAAASGLAADAVPASEPATAAHPPR